VIRPEGPGGPLDLVLSARRRSLGADTVDRVLPAPQRRHVGPYIFLDHIGPTHHPIAVAAHPHIGLSTLTYLLAGELVHRDSLGTVRTIHPGAVNWMTAGRGISHSERVPPGFTADGGTVHGLQLWVGLTEPFEEVEPAFQHVDGPDLPTVALDGAVGRIIAGTAYGQHSPLHVYSPQFCVDMRVTRGARVALPAEHDERAAYVVEGRVTVDGTSYEARKLLVFAPGGPAEVVADEDSTLLLLGGAPIAGPHMWWNFVSSRRERIEQAKRDWAEGRFALPPDDADEVIPLPDDGVPRPEPMS
jgi:redox-sensitive bicupin YhaK (pirin superfamily)